jgi:hypothetical protein
MVINGKKSAVMHSSFENGDRIKQMTSENAYK